MARPTTKEELINAATIQMSNIWKLIDSMTEDVQQAPFLFDDRDNNIRDVLVHLYEWHRLLLNWVQANINGETKPFIPEPYGWKTYSQMNVVFWKTHQATAYEDSIQMLKDTHAKVLKLIESFTNEELFTKKYYTWTGTTTLGSYCISATSSHYDWALKKLRKHVKLYKESHND